MYDNSNDDLDIVKQAERIQDQIKTEASEMENRLNTINPDSAYEKQLDVKPLTFAESSYLLDGRPLRFTNRDYLELIYNSDIIDGLLMCGRQVEKSTTFSVNLANWTLLTPFFRGLYFAPLTEQVKVFSEDRLGRLFQYSQGDIIANTFIDRRVTKQNVFNKSFLNGSLIYLRHCFEQGDNIRGLSVNGLFGDEIQDIDIDALPVVEETQAHAYELGPGVKISWKSGTPKTFSNTIQQLWEQSNQCEWVVRCLHCGTDQILGLKNLAPNKYICRKCGKELNRFNIAKNGRWIKTNSKSTKWGFRITQMMNPAMRAEDTWDKLYKYTKSKFYNEVLGRSYENAEKPFTPGLLNSLCENEYPMYIKAEGEFANKRIFMGVDWGRGEKSKTIVVIGSINNDNRFQVLYTKSYDIGDEMEPEYQFKDIVRLMGLFKINYAIFDIGDGFAQCKKLKSMYGARVDMCYYSGNQKKKRRYDIDKKMWVVNRTDSLFDYVTAVHQFKVVWPGAEREKLDHMFNDHLAVQTEYRSTKPRSEGGNVASLRSEEMMYTHPIASPDDSFHASHYCYMAYLLNLVGYGDAPSSGIEFFEVYGSNI